MRACAFCLKPAQCALWGHDACYRCFALWGQRLGEEVPPNATPDAMKEFTDQLVIIAAKKRGAA